MSVQIRSRRGPLARGLRKTVIHGWFAWVLMVLVGSGCYLDHQSEDDPFKEQWVGPGGLAGPGPGQQKICPCTVHIMDGDGQHAQVGQLLPNALAVAVTADDGTSINSGEVVWLVASGGGTVSSGHSTAGSDGLFRTQWTLGSDPALQQIAKAYYGETPTDTARFDATATAPPPAHHQDTFFDDFSVASASWRTVIQFQGDASITERAEWQPTGGHDGGYREMTYEWPQNLINHPGPDLQVAYVWDGGVYEPAIGGPVDHIVFQADRMMSLPTNRGTIIDFFVIEQNGQLYIAVLPVLNYGGQWEQVTKVFTRTDFVGGTVPLDWSVNGAPMKFGYGRSTRSYLAITFIHGIDNWRVQVRQ
jgi:hypothetical protein